MDLFVKAIILETARDEAEREEKIRTLAAFETKLLSWREPTTKFVKVWLHIQKAVYTSYVSERFQYTYKPRGIVFETETLPAYVLPLNSVALQDLYTYLKTEKGMPRVDAVKLVREKFVFERVERMNSMGDTNYFVSEYEKLRGTQLPEEERYTEIIFPKSIQIAPRAFFGFSESEIEQLYGLVSGSAKSELFYLPKFSTALKAIKYLRERAVHR